MAVATLPGLGGTAGQKSSPVKTVAPKKLIPPGAPGSNGTYGNGQGTFGPQVPRGTNTTPPKVDPATHRAPPVDRPSNTPVVGNSPRSVTSADLSGARQMLIAANYDVAPTGPMTPRLQKALAHYQATKGTGGAVWNAHNTKAVTVTRAPATNPADSITAPGLGNGDPTTVPGGNVPGTLSFSKQLLAQLAKEFHPYTGDNGQAPQVDANALGAAQANEQYGGAINAQRTQINDMNGAEPIAQQNISKYFAPVQTQAANAVASDDASSAANVAAQAKLSPELSAALGLSGAAAGQVAGAGTNATDFASNLGAITHADDVAQQSASANNEEQAHATEDANNTVALSNARTNLINQIANKGNAQVTDTANAKQQNFANRSQAITNAGAISNINATNAVAASTVEGADLDNQGKQQTLGINQLKAKQTTAQLTDSMKGTTLSRGIAKQTQALNVSKDVLDLKRLIQTPIPGSPTKATVTPFGQIDAGTREKMAATLWPSVANLPPDKAERVLNQYMTSVWNMTSTPLTRTFVKGIIANHQWDPKSKSYAVTTAP